MTKFSRVVVALFVSAAAAATLWMAVVSGSDRSQLAAALTDQQFWELTESVSEPGGSFQSDNFLSNERGYQAVIPALLRIAKPGRVYLGVGPEQNFPYIIALKPALAIIFDVRRGNLHEHLLYKALLEMSTDRADFLARLFCRQRPAGLSASSTVPELMRAYAFIEPSPMIYEANMKAVSDWLTKKHGFPLSREDISGIDYVYRTAFYGGGPNLSYNLGRTRDGRIGLVNNMVNGGTYADIQSLDDGTGLNRGFLGSEENWRTLKDIQTRNLVVPVVGDFGGPKAIRAVGRYLKERGGVVSAFYLSNVEQYLNRSRTEDVFLCNVAQLPLDETSTFIYTGTGRYGLPGGGILNATFVRPILRDTRDCGSGTPKG